jgi:predicted Zn-dependent protease
MYGFGYSPYRCVKLMETMKDDPDGGGIFSAGTDRSGNAGSLLSQATEELGNVLRTHPAEDKRICLVKNHIVRLQEAYPREILYVGRWNLENRTPMFRDWR